MTDSVRKAFSQAVSCFIETLTRVGPDRWDQPGLDQWTVRDLVGHTSRALLTVETYLERPAATIDIARPADYFVRVQEGYANREQIAQRGREAGAALGPDLAAAVREIADRVLRLVDDTADERLFTTPIGGMRLVDYLPSRTFELVVHTLDLASALDLEVEIPAEALADCLALAGGVAVGLGNGKELLLALTGRRPLAPGFSVVV